MHNKSYLLNATMKISQIYPAAHRKNEILLIMVVEIIKGYVNDSGSLFPV